MPLFRAKKKDIETFETERDLPAFSVDTNGFIMFNDPRLGGAAVLEVIPHVTTEGMTHEDPVFHDTSTDEKGYEPSIDTLFGDVRREAIPAWVNFLNRLEPEGTGDSCIHIQIIAKKCRADEWETRADYAVYSAHKEWASELSRVSFNKKNKKEKFYASRVREYVKLLEELQEASYSVSENIFDVRRLPAYKTRFFLVISYTPSSEGWWLDGRDADYYVRDDKGPMNLFKEDKSVERVTAFLTRKLRKEQKQEEGGSVNDFFWIESDRTAQVLYTRQKKVFRIINEWNNNHPYGEKMPFHLNLLDGREVAALICFYPNILTPYWDRIWSLDVDSNDMLFRQQVRTALDVGDTDFIERANRLTRDIAHDTVNVGHALGDRDDFLDKYRGRAYEEIGNVSDEYDEMNWSPEREFARKQRQQEIEYEQQKSRELWGDFDESLTIEDEFKTESQRREDFLKRYKSKNINNNQNSNQNGKQNNNKNINNRNTNNNRVNNKR